MAQLTLSQRAEMANSLSLQRRLVSAFKKQAEYWKNYTVTTFAQYNEKTRKCKTYSRQILNESSIANIQSIAEYFLSQYNTDPPVLDSSGELADSELTDSPASAATYEFFAGVKMNDDTKQIEL